MTSIFHADPSEGIHVVVTDLFPPGPHDPQGMHGVIGERFDEESDLLPHDEPLTLVSYVAHRMLYAYLENLAVGSTLVEMPLFLDLDRWYRTRRAASASRTLSRWLSAMHCRTWPCF